MHIYPLIISDIALWESRWSFFRTHKSLANHYYMGDKENFSTSAKHVMFWFHHLGIELRIMEVFSFIFVGFLFPFPFPFPFLESAFCSSLQNYYRYWILITSMAKTCWHYPIFNVLNHLLPLKFVWSSVIMITKNGTTI